MAALLAGAAWGGLIGWLMLGWYAILNAIVTTFGRLGFGVGQSLAPRYGAFSVYLGVSVIFLGAIVCQEIARF